MPHLLFMLFQVKKVKFQAWTTCQKPSPTLFASFSYTFLRQLNFFYYFLRCLYFFTQYPCTYPFLPEDNPDQGIVPVAGATSSMVSRSQPSVHSTPFGAMYISYYSCTIACHLSCLQPCSQHFPGTIRAPRSKPHTLDPHHKVVI